MLALGRVHKSLCEFNHSEICVVLFWKVEANQIVLKTFSSLFYFSNSFSQTVQYYLNKSVSTPVYVCLGPNGSINSVPVPSV